MSQTLLNLQQSLADRHDSGKLPTDSTKLALWTRHFNRGKNYCAKQLSLQKTASVVVASGTGTLPTDFYAGTDDVYLDGVQFVQDDAENIHSGNVFWIDGSETGGYTFNSLTDGTYDVTYLYLPADMVNTSDICPIPDGEAVVAYAYAMIRKSETDPIGDVKDTLQEVDSRITDMSVLLNKNGAPLGFTIV